MDYVKNLKFDQNPNYSMLKSLIKITAAKEEFDLFDDVYDWSLILT